MKETKRCCDCRKVKAIPEDFYKKRVGASGVQQYLSYCKSCSADRKEGFRSPLKPPWTPPTEKRCGMCQDVFPIEDFYVHKSGRQEGQPLSYCKACTDLRKDRWALENPEKMKAFRQRYWREKGRDRQLFHKYGLTQKAFDELLARQKGKCASCSFLFPDRKSMRVDHNHESGVVRAILCHSCNVALGLLKEDPRRVRQLLRYIERIKNGTCS